MTPAPQKEYIVTEEQLLKMTSWATSKGANVLMEEVMTHPLEAELQKDREKVINLIERFIKVAIAICDEPHGKLSNPAGVKGMKSSLTILKGVVNQCRTDEGMSQLEEHLNKEVK